MRLELFGGLRLEMPEGTPSGRATQPRRLAILALLALSRNRTIRRDEIVAYLSPDRREDVARRQLSKAVYDLRSLLGESALEGGGDTLTLRTDALEMDTVRFDSAVRGSRWSEAIELYRGDLLEGVDLGGLSRTGALDR
jgi:DNA-binding SARP family transcriptional activator